MKCSRFMTILLLVLIHCGQRAKMTELSKTPNKANDATDNQLLQTSNSSDHDTLDISTHSLITFVLEEETTTETYLDFTEGLGLPTNASSTEIYSALNTTDTPVIPVSPSEPQKKTYFWTYCFCDNTVHFCDLNCCCDDDCSNEEKKIFIHCSSDSQKTFNVDPRYCSSQQPVQNNRWFLESYSNNMFCIAKDNLPPKRNKIKYEVMRTLTSTRQIASHFHSWTFYYHSLPSYTYVNKPYRMDEIIWTVVNFTLQPLDVHSPSLNNYCDTFARVKYFKNFKSKCFLKSTEMKLFYTYQQLLHKRIISSPLLFDLQKQSRNCSDIICLPMEVFLCNISNAIDKGCILVNNTEDTGLIANRTNDIFVEQMKYIFLCNNSVIQRVSVYLQVVDLVVVTNYGEVVIEGYFQFQRFNHSFKPLVLSGSPCYVVGKPVIAARIINETYTKDHYYSNNISFPTENILIYPKNVKGICVLSNVSYNEIIFGENVVSKCKYIIDHNIMKSENASDACNAIQELVLRTLDVEDKTLFQVSPFGHPNTDWNNEWIRFIIAGENGSEGYFENKILVCKNFIRSIQYEFTFANVHLPNTDRNGAKILGSTLNLLRSDVSYKMNSTISEILTVTTIFYDITVPPDFEFAKGPRLNMYIPSDFFYPLTMNLGVSESSSVKYCVFYCLSVLVLLLK